MRQFKTFPSEHRAGAALWEPGEVAQGRRARGAILPGAPIPLACSLVALASCYTSYQVRPEELAKLEQFAATPEQKERIARPPAAGDRRHRLIAEDGRAVEVGGKVEATITTTEGYRYQFDHPVTAVRRGDFLELRGGNREIVYLPLLEIARAEVSYFDRRKTLYGLAGTVAAMVLAVTLVAAGEFRH